MYIAYSALQAAPQQQALNLTEPDNTELQLRYRAYQTVCNKYRHEIARIQQYLPDWQPNLPTV